MKCLNRAENLPCFEEVWMGIWDWTFQQGFSIKAKKQAEGKLSKNQIKLLISSYLGKIVIKYYVCNDGKKGLNMLWGPKLDPGTSKIQ